jgi:hypothetical protein
MRIERARWLVSFVLAAGTVLGVGLTACSSPSNPQKSARGYAASSCRQLVGLGGHVVSGQAITAAAAVKTLAAARGDADHAARLDSSWKTLDVTVKDIQEYLETGQRQALGGTLDDLAAYCQPLVPASPG